MTNAAVDVEALTVPARASVAVTLDIQNTGVGTVTLTATKTGATVTATDALAGPVNASTSTAALVMDGSAETSEIITYTGGTGNDVIKGGAAADVLKGTSGNDTITGGLAADAITLGTGTNQVVFTGGLTVDAVTGYSADDIGAFDLSSLETVDLVVTGTTTLDFIQGDGTSVSAGDAISMQTIAGASTLASGTNVLSFTAAAAADAAAIEVLLEASSGIITTGGVTATADAFVIQYEDTDQTQSCV
jgi:Ca2+-binding RTX toxin-like protein